MKAAHPNTLLGTLPDHFGDTSGSVPKVLLAGAGKASVSLAHAFLRKMPLSEAIGCLVIPEWGHSRECPGSVPRFPRLPGLTVVRGSHPVPSIKSVRAAKVLLRFIRERQEGSEIVFFLSGGASALMELPVPTITLADFQKTTELLLTHGARIDEMNTVRKHLSQVKGGRLAAAMGDARVTTIVLSDVDRDRLDVIGSGPTYPDPSTYADALAVLSRFAIEKKVPRMVRKFLTDGARGKNPETPKPGNPLFRRHRWIVIGNLSNALLGGKKKGETLGFQVKVEWKFVTGEAQQVGRKLVSIAKRLPPNTLLMAGGEPTVRVTGRGKGGRCQEAALSFAIASDGKREMHILAAGTDGRDGPTDAAGAYASNETAFNGRKMGLDPAKYLSANDSYAFFKRVSGLIQTGLTGTNVNDLFLVLIP